MFRKKQKQQLGRNVQRPRGANVFSYYNSRAPSESSYTRRSEVGGTDNGRRTKWLSYIPSIFAGLALVACLFYVSTLNPTPKVRVVGSETQHRLVKNPDVYESEIRGIMERSIINRSKLLIDTDKVAREITEAYPELGDVAIVLPLVSRRPIVEIQPTEPAMILTSSNETFIIDENGRAIAYARDVESSIRDNLPVVQDESSVSLERGKVILPSESVAVITEVYRQLAEKKINPESMILPGISNELHLRIKDKPYYVKFDLKGDGREQTGTFLAVKDQLEKENKTPAEYIDVRVPGKVFYK